MINGKANKIIKSANVESNYINGIEYNKPTKNRQQTTTKTKQHPAPTNKHLPLTTLPQTKDPTKNHRKTKKPKT